MHIRASWSFTITLKSTCCASIGSADPDARACPNMQTISQADPPNYLSADQQIVERIMPVGEICTREVVIVKRNDSVLEAAKLMRQHHVGDVVVIEERGGVRVPVGIVTDRDLVVEILAPQLDPA